MDSSSQTTLFPSREKAFINRYDQIISNPWMQAYYGHTGFYNVGFWQPSTQTQAKASRQLVETLLNQFPSHQGKILDVACGLGATTQHLLKTYASENITGINLSCHQLENCRHRLPDICFLRMDAAHLSFPEASFDRMLCVEAAFHFRTRFHFFQEAQRVLKPGGWISLSDMLIDSPAHFGEWMIPSTNQGIDLKMYQAQWLQAGFQDICIVDATDCCWTSYCRHLVRALAHAFTQGQISETYWRESEHYFEQLLSTPSVQYLLVSAQKTA